MQYRNQVYLSLIISITCFFITNADVSLINLSNSGLNSYGIAQAAPKSEKTRARFWLERKAKLIKKKPVSSSFFAKRGQTLQVQCGPSTCTCKGINDCDALFTSSKCQDGSATVDPDDNGECKRAD